MDMLGQDLSLVPAAEPPAGVIPNFIDPPSQEQLPMIFTYVTLPPMVIFILLRFYSRIKFSQLAVDDYMCAVAAVINVAYMVLAFRAIHQAAGPHLWDVPLSRVTTAYAQNCTTMAALYFVSATFIKVAILLLYKRIFHPSPLANAMIWGGIVFTILFYFVSITIFLTYCIPRPVDDATGGWLSPQYASRCYRADGRITVATGIVGAIIDVYILLVPLWFLWGLHTSVKRKMGLSAIFLTGSVACAFAIAGSVFRMRIATPDHSEQDLTWNTMPIYATSIGEIAIGVVCSCMPVVFVLFKSVGIRSSSWISKIRDASFSRRRQNDSSGASDIRALNYQGLDQDSLPQIPNGAMTGIGSYIRNLGRSKITRTQTEQLTMASADYNYHEQLKQGVKN